MAIVHIPTLVLGAGAAGMMCAAHSGPGTVVIDHAKTAGEKIRISGGGRCNFTNMYAGAENFISANPHFAKSALKRYTQWDFIALVDRHKIAWHEKTLGQLFCDDSATQIIRMLQDEMAKADAALWLQTSLDTLEHDGHRFRATLTRNGTQMDCTVDSVVVACGGKSIPKIGASGRGYQIASQFGLAVTETRPGLVPLTFGDRFTELSGVSLPARISSGGASFDEALLFTHRGLSGPAILQASSYWREGEQLTVRLDPGTQWFDALRTARQSAGKKGLTTVLADMLPKRLVTYLDKELGLSGRLANHSDADLRALCQHLEVWNVTPTGSEGYRKAEVTLGGVDTAELSSKTMEATSVRGLYFIGEVVDVTGWLGGYNFQWAWSSGWAAGTAIAAAKKAA